VKNSFNVKIRSLYAAWDVAEPDNRKVRERELHNLKTLGKSHCAQAPV